MVVCLLFVITIIIVQCLCFSESAGSDVGDSAVRLIFLRGCLSQEVEAGGNGVSLQSSDENGGEEEGSRQNQQPRRNIIRRRIRKKKLTIWTNGSNQWFLMSILSPGIKLRVILLAGTSQLQSLDCIFHSESRSAKLSPTQNLRTAFVL